MPDPITTAVLGLLPGRAEWLVIGLLLLGVLVLFRHGHQVRNWLPGIVFFLVLAVLGLFALKWFGYSQALYETARQSARSADDWVPSQEHGHTANVYPSRRSAAIALSRQLAEDMEALIGRQCDELYLDGSIDVRVALDALDAFQRSSTIPIGNVITGRKPVVLDADDLHLVIDDHVAESDQARVPSEATGYVTGTLAGPEREISCRARYDRKLWLTDPQMYQAFERDRAVFRCVGRSPGLWATQDQALEEAMSDAADDLADQVERHMPSRRRPGHVDRAWLRQELRARLQQGSLAREPTARGPQVRLEPLVQDRFVQQFDMPHARVWRAAVLVEASPAQVEALSRVMEDRLEQRHVRGATRWGSVAGLILLIVVVYLFLNAATKGYYTWALRGAAVVLFVVGTLCVVVFFV